MGTSRNVIYDIPEQICLPGKAGSDKMVKSAEAVNEILTTNIVG